VEELGIIVVGESSANSTRVTEFVVDLTDTVEV
jgi:hypothetical protein